ncbi:hypothetical protein [Kitasatospora purpeofusca]|uniref:hypothetical protein n=1 Tax=Kitasatospora purpeofusca TaxID=67352 RepID=UPI000B0C0014|nr:hypothetical protein [Kitasatospora purpeofusca]
MVGIVRAAEFVLQVAGVVEGYMEGELLGSAGRLRPPAVFEVVGENRERGVATATQRFHSIG